MTSEHESALRRLASGATFTVVDVFAVTGRGPVITRSSEESNAARDRGERWTAGDVARCGDLEARVTGIERFLIPNAADGALMLDIDITLLTPGQVWEQVTTGGASL